MREIKFRGWDGQNMLSNEYLRTNGFNPINKLWIDGVEVIWMQYTGLKDKNDVDIYEGDIFLFREVIKNVVEFKYGTFVYNASRDSEFENFVNLSNSHFEWIDGKAHDIEVIGNIYENKDLLK